MPGYEKFYLNWKQAMFGNRNGIIPRKFVSTNNILTMQAWKHGWQLLMLYINIHEHTHTQTHKPCCHKIKRHIKHCSPA